MIAEPAHQPTVDETHHAKFPAGQVHTADYLKRIGVQDLGGLTCPFDPGYDPVTVRSHIEQSSHLMAILKISMACWLIANEAATREKFAAAKANGVRTVTGGGPFEVAAAQGELPAYLDLCADVGADRVECGEGFTDLTLKPRDVIALIEQRHLEAQFEMGKKHTGPFDATTLEEWVTQGQRWLDAGAKQVVVEARESARGVGLFDLDGNLNYVFADRIAQAFGLETAVYEAPTKASQFALLDHFGAHVQLCNVRLEELLRVEIYRRGLHSDAFDKENLRPPRPVHSGAGQLT